MRPRCRPAAGSLQTCPGRHVYRGNIGDIRILTACIAGLLVFNTPADQQMKRTMQEIDATATVDRELIGDDGQPTGGSAVTVYIDLPDDVPASALDVVSVEHDSC